MPRVSPCSNSAINWGSTASRPACICCLIPFLVHESINNPRPGDDRSNALRLLFEVPECGFEVIFERVQAVEDMVVEALLAQFVPDVLDRVELGMLLLQSDSASPPTNESPRPDGLQAANSEGSDRRPLV